MVPRVVPGVAETRGSSHSSILPWGKRSSSCSRSLPTNMDLPALAVPTTKTSRPRLAWSSASVAALMPLPVRLLTSLTSRTRSLFLSSAKRSHSRTRSASVFGGSRSILVPTTRSGFLPTISRRLRRKEPLKSRTSRMYTTRHLRSRMERSCRVRASAGTTRPPKPSSGLAESPEPSVSCITGFKRPRSSSMHREQRILRRSFCDHLRTY
mmetsp:Transcript_31267/g.89686  ORF Transcript_31267/g.89686 Transcript_31267/m.89686 type:complete len:210 (-) Transcript_31267:322-951(-)